MNTNTLRRAITLGVFAVLFVMLLGGPSTLLSAAQKGDTSPDSKTKRPAINWVFDSADEVVDAAVLENPLWYDADIASRTGELCYTWLEYTRGKGDRIWIGSRTDGTWTMRVEAIKQLGNYANPTLTVDAKQRLWLSYEAESNEQWDVFVAEWHTEEGLGPIRRVSSGKGSDIHHSACADPTGGIWFVWQSDCDGQFNVLARHIREEELNQTVTVGDQPYGDWHPSVAVGPDGSVHVVWDAYDGQSFNVYARSMRNGSWRPVVGIAQSLAFEGRAQIVIDKNRRVWVAWEEGGENWGGRYVGRRTDNFTDQKGPLHRFRMVRLAMLEQDGTVRPLQQPLPLPSIRKAKERSNAKPGVVRTGAFYERARLAVDRVGRVWVAYRHYYTPWMGVGTRGGSSWKPVTEEFNLAHEGGWGVYARYFGANGWSKLYAFPIGQGDGMQSLEIVPHADGIAAVWTTGRTDMRPSDRRPRGIVTGTVSGKGSPAEQIALATAVQASPLATIRRQARPKSLELGGKQYHLLFGDLHRHTDLSICRIPVDGTIDDAYRYAIDVAGLDFFATTDHARDMAFGDRFSQVWWRDCKEVTRHQLRRKFFPFFAYERSGRPAPGADHNVVSLRADILRSHQPPIEEFWRTLGNDTFTIPHLGFRPDTWKHKDDVHRPLMEIYQGMRNRSGEREAHEGLDKGHHVGFIASSDHQSTSAAYACVWAEEATRESIFRAMQARRTYAATAKIWLAFRAGDHWMGEIINATAMPPLRLEAIGTAPFRDVVLVVDGKPYEQLVANSRHVKLHRKLSMVGKHYVYFHLTQTDGSQAWSSPIWMNINSPSTQASQ